MTEEAKKKKDAENGEETTPKKKGGMMKIIMMAGIGIVVIALTAVGTLFILGTDEPVADNQTTEEVQDSTTGHASTEGHSSEEGHTSTAGHTSETDHNKDKSTGTTKEASNSHDENIFDPNDPSVMESIMEQLAILDYKPDDSELEPEDVKAAKADSINKMIWFETEQARLDKWQKELATKENKLTKLDRDIQKKIIIIDQAESTRIASIAKLYDGMDARSVAALMANLDDHTVVSILPRMKTKNASNVLAILSPRRAAKLSKQMITIAEK